MILSVLIASAFALGDAPKDARLKATLSVVPDREISAYDVLFLRVIVTNTDTRPILLQTSAGHNDSSLSILLAQPESKDEYRFPPGAGYASTYYHQTPLPPGETRTMYYLERPTLRVPAPFPPEAEHPFWRNLGDRIVVKARLRLAAEPVSLAELAERKQPWFARGKIDLLTESAPIRIKPRPQEEIAKLFERAPGDSAVNRTCHFPKASTGCRCPS